MIIKISIELIAEIDSQTIDSSLYDSLHATLSRHLAVGTSDCKFKDLKIRSIHEVKQNV